MREAMLRVMRNHRRAAYGEVKGYEALSTHPVALDHAACPQADMVAHAKAAWDNAPSRLARSTATATPRPR